MLELKSIVCLFENQVTRFSSRYALSVGEQRLTYAELNAKANQLARYLLKIKASIGPYLPVILEKSVESIISILGILKAGLAYIPISPESTASMINSIFVSAGARYAIVNSDKSSLVKQPNVKLILLDKIQKKLDELSKENLDDKPLSSDFSYVIYTSGTTGNPKGVLVTHANLLHTFNSWKSAYQLTENDIHLQMANVAFDVFVGDYLRALCSGSELVLCSKEDLVSPKRLYNLIIDKKITCAEFIPAILRNLLSYLEDNNLLLTQMRLLICGSDLWTMGEFRKATKLVGPYTRVINSYGLTEATIDSTYFEDDGASYADAELVPIGKPFSHVKLYLLDENQNPINNEVGEIYVGGAGVAAGYLGQAVLTKEKFCFHPKNHELLYKTGDLGRLRTDGTIELLGRNQSHVKINGNRVELLSLETTVNQHPKIKTGIATTFFEDNKAELVCFVQICDDTLTFEELTSHIITHLPKSYIPKKIYIIEDIALTQNGKVDRSHLAQKIRSELKRNIIDPQNTLEHKILDTWKKILSLDEISVIHNFYELGGSSLDFAEMIGQFNEVFEVSLTYCGAALNIRELTKQISEMIANKSLVFME